MGVVKANKLKKSEMIKKMMDINDDESLTEIERSAKFSYWLEQFTVKAKK